jgi:magnesium-transporting ATPase (P-type)
VQVDNRKYLGGDLMNGNDHMNYGQPMGSSGYPGQQGYPGQPGYMGQQGSMGPMGPMRQLNTRRSLLKYIFLPFVTLGIYQIVFWSGISTDINTIAGRYDGKKTMHYCLLLFVFAIITFTVAAFVWNHRLANRMGNELRRRNIYFELSASTFWLWGILGAFIVVGPFIYAHKMAKASNLLAQHYNVNG